MLGSWFGGRNNPTPAASLPQREPSAQQRVKILMVDDNAANLLSLESVLESLGEELVRAQSGREALKRCLEDDFAVILLDVKMPDMDGFETAQLIRARDRSRHTPILFLTGYRNEEQLYRGYYMGAVDFLFKPIVPEILRSKVAVFVELSRNSELLRRQTEAVQQKNAELEEAFAAHRKTEQRFRALLEAAPDAMVISDSAGRIDLVNSQTEKLLGYAREELLGRDIRMLVPEWQYREGAQPAQETVGLHKDGGRVSVEISSSPLQTEQGLLVTSALRDMTERKRNEERIHHLNASLEQRVQERTAELLRSNDELKQFAYVASHDLQEPLRMVASYVQLLGKRYKGKLDTDADEFIEYVVQGVHRMHDLINDLLAFSRIDTRETSFRDVDMDSVMHEVRMNLQLMMQENQATVTNDALPELTADSVQMVQLLQNLVGNAMKYRRPDAPPCVHVSAQEAAAEDGSLEWLFRVQDNGIGIEPQYTEIVFGIFKRLHSRDRYPGTGIGLAICKRIVERHGGRIWVESTPGQGSLFQFTIPV